MNTPTTHSTRFTATTTTKRTSPLYFKYAIRLMKQNHSQMLNTSSSQLKHNIKHNVTPPYHHNIKFSKYKYFNNTSFNKTFTKGKFFKALNSNLIYSQRKVKFLNIKYKDNDDVFNKQIYINKNNIFNTNTKSNLNLIKSASNSFRYEDIYITPEEFLKKKFTANEINIIFKAPSAFNLNNEPFKECKLKICKSLIDVLNKENSSKRTNNNNSSNNNGGKRKTHSINNKSKPTSPHYLSPCSSVSNYFNSSTVSTRSNNNNMSQSKRKGVKYVVSNIKPLVISKPNTPHVNSFTCKSSGKSQEKQLKAIFNKQAKYEDNRMKYYQHKQQKISYKELLLQGKTNVKKEKILQNIRDYLYTYDISKEIQHNYHTLSP